MIMLECQHATSCWRPVALPSLAVRTEGDAVILFLRGTRNKLGRPEGQYRSYVRP